MKILLCNKFYYRRGGDNLHKLSREPAITKRFQGGVIGVIIHPLLFRGIVTNDDS